uniref:VGCC_alpha2 domain-containing protein n=1 Tax=Macrostomum lignano TaxID=282301 RepID=A0A1I8HY07_9PLAT
RSLQKVSDGLGHLIGVAGLDVPVNQFERLGPAWELGLMAYIFMATNNGFILFHPEFRPVNEAGEMQMFYNNQDIADVEVPADGTPTNGRPSYDLSLRSAMIQRVTGFVDMVKVKTFDDMSRGTKQKFRYFHAPLNSTAPFGVATETRPTPFSLGLALPWGSAGQWPPVAAYPTAPPFDSYSLHRENLAKLFSKRLINSTCDAAKPELYKTGLAEFEFCDFSSELLAEYGVNPLCALGSVLEMPLARQQAMGCSFEYLKRVMVDALSTREAYEWETNWNTIVPAQIGATLLFLWTGTGLARWQTPPTNDAQSVIDASFAAARRNGSRDSLYERTALLASSSDSSLTVLTAPSGDSVFARFKANTSVPIYLTSALRVESSVVGVVGAEINYDRLANYFVNATNSCVSGVGGGACVTCAQTNVRCYLLDDSGAVVVSESQTDVGKTFDIVNCPAMQLMINRSLFVTVKAFDFQAVCLKKTPVDSSASTLFNPIRALMRLASWAFIEGFLLLADLTSSTLRVIKAGAQEFGMASSRSTAEDCHRVDASRPDSILKVYERVDAMIAETADLVAPHPDASLKVQEIRRRLMQPLCIGRTADDQDEEEACEYLCKRLPEQFGIGLVSDLLAGCPKFDEAQIDCTVKRTLLRREPRQPLPTSAMRLQCPLLGLCEACQPGANGSSEFNVYVRQVSGTNLMFVAVTGDPNCDCTGCPLAVITEKLSGTRNISVQQRFRERPPWSRPNVVLIDNSTVCSKTAVPSLTILQSLRWLLSFLVLLNLLVFSSDF